MGIRAAAVGAVYLVLLTVGAANAGAVLPGPNGRIVFTSGRDDGVTALDDAHAQLWVAARAGATPARVTFNTAIQHRHASWSPDRTRLVYSAGSAATGAYDIWILDLTQPASGSNPRQVTNTPMIAEDRPSWSPDGTRIAYQRKILGSSAPAQIAIQSVLNPLAPPSVLTQPSGTGDAGKPVWSPDSGTLYYSLVVNPGAPPPVDDDIYAKAADDSGVARPIVTGPTDDYQPALSPDGQSLCFTRGAFGTTAATVQRSTIQGQNVIQIANSGLGDYNCAWSPDGTQIAYVQGTFSNGELMVRPADGTGTATALVPNVPGRFDGNPEWTRNPSPACSGAPVVVVANRAVSIPLRCVDPAPENDPVTVSIVSPPRHGSLGSLVQGAVTYRPARNFSGTDSFTFRGNDGTSDSNLAVIRLTVTPAGPPRLSALRVSPARWRLGSHLARLSNRGAPVGTTISFRLSTPGRVRLTFTRVRAGRRPVAAGSLRLRAHAGVDRIRFEGRLSRTRSLGAGSYRLTVVATDAAGRRSRPATASFTIVGR